MDPVRIITEDYHHPRKCGGCGSKNGHWNGEYFECYDCKVETQAGSPTEADYNAPEQCEGCGRGVWNGRFPAKFRKITDGPFLVGDCCGDRDTGMFHPQYDPNAELVE
jgi:hypothetical protein